ncbi:MAG: DUF1648 domain-containing protein [Chloroflexi bacterium]|nr:DUF1648 domain-containing protein [Chloroflexota bacterium]
MTNAGTSPRTRSSLDLPLLGLSLAALAGNGALWGWLVLRLPSLAASVPIHYNAAGQVDRVGGSHELLILPIIGLVTIVLNGALAVLVLRRERQLCYVLAGVAAVVQLLLAGSAAQLVK